MSYFDDHEDEIVYGGRARRTPNVECKRCGKGGLHWVEVEGGFTLVNHAGLVHKCTAMQVSSDDFEPIA